MPRQNLKEKIVLDLETKRSFAEVEGRNLSLLGVSVVGIYSYADDEFKVFPEQDIALLLPYLQRAQLVIGFNIKGFDFPVLQPYLDFDLSNLAALDILEEVYKTLGFRLSLNSIALATLEIGKIGSGLDALKYFRQGQIDKLTQYCQQDVLITRQLYEYGQKYGHLIYQRGQNLETIPVSWGQAQTVDEILRQGFTQRQSLEIEYSSSQQPAQRNRRKIDIYDFNLARIVAYCHLRGALRTFNLRRVLAVKLLPEHYQIPADFRSLDYKPTQNV